MEMYKHYIISQDVVLWTRVTPKLIEEPANLGCKFNMRITYSCTYV